MTALMGCATSKDTISPSYVSSLAFQSYNCDQLTGESNRLANRIQSVGSSIDDDVENDKLLVAIGLLVFWPALAFTGGDREERNEFSRLKGEYNTIQLAASNKNCRNVFREIDNGTATHFVGDPVRNMNADLANQQRSEVTRTSEEDVAKLRTAFSDNPAYLKILDTNYSNSSYPTSRTTAPPNYPAGLTSIDALVRVAFIISEDGSVEGARILETSDSRFSDSALDSVKQWSFYPGSRDGKPAKFIYNIPIQFISQK